MAPELLVTEIYPCGGPLGIYRQTSAGCMYHTPKLAVSGVGYYRDPQWKPRRLFWGRNTTDALLDRVEEEKGGVPLRKVSLFPIDALSWTSYSCITPPRRLCIELRRESESSPRPENEEADPLPPG